jgi:hypothetical protein
MTTGQAMVDDLSAGLVRASPTSKAVFAEVLACSMKEFETRWFEQQGVRLQLRGYWQFRMSRRPSARRWAISAGRRQGVRASGLRTTVTMGRNGTMEVVMQALRSGNRRVVMGTVTIMSTTDIGRRGAGAEKRVMRARWLPRQAD